jgi:hypothetical protein
MKSGTKQPAAQRKATAAKKPAPMKPPAAKTMPGTGKIPCSWELTPTFARATLEFSLAEYGAAMENGTAQLLGTVTARGIYIGTAAPAKAASHRQPKGAPAKKSTISAAGRKAIAAATKARWAKVKAAKAGTPVPEVAHGAGATL